MLQYPVQLPPLSLSSSKRTPTHGRDRDLDDRRNGHSRLAKLAVHDRVVPPLPPTISVTPLSIPTALSPTSSASASTYPSPLPSPVLSSTLAKPILRSSLTSSPRQLPSPVPRSPHPLRSEVPSFDGRSRSSGHSSISSSIVDVLSQGDLVGDGLYLQGEIISRVPISSSEPRVDYDEPAKEFEVVRKLGTGSYAVVYLVREVLSRPLPSDDGHAIAVGRMDLDDGSFGNQSTEYGREYAIKVLSKANLDEDALTAQLFEVRPAYMRGYAMVYLTVSPLCYRPRFTSLSRPTPTSSRFIAPSRPLLSCFFFSSSYPVKIFSTFSNKPATTTKPTLPQSTCQPRLRFRTRAAPLAPRQRQAFFPPSTLRSCSRAPAFA